MTSIDIFQTVMMGLTALGMLYVALRKVGSERSSLNGSGAESFAKAAQVYADENIELKREIQEMNKRIDKVEKKKYRITINFEISDPPSVGIVTIEPILDLNSSESHIVKKSINSNHYK